MLQIILCDIIINIARSEHKELIQTVLFDRIRILNLIVENYRK